jgi:hypothetical protein
LINLMPRSRPQYSRTYTRCRIIEYMKQRPVERLALSKLESVFQRMIFFTFQQDST